MKRTYRELIRIRIYGIPKPGGSKRYVGRSKKTGRAILIDASDNKDWRAACSAEAACEMIRHRSIAFDGPLAVEVSFYLPRPAGHKANKGGLRKGALPFPSRRPDATKLMRSLEDAMTGIVWNDDAQIVEQTVSKNYADEEPVGAAVTVMAVLPA